MCRCRRRAGSALAHSPRANWKRWVPLETQGFSWIRSQSTWRTTKDGSATAATSATRHSHQHQHKDRPTVPTCPRWLCRWWPNWLRVRRSWIRQWPRLWTSSYRSTEMLRGLLSTKTDQSWKAYPNLTSSLEHQALGIVGGTSLRLGLKVATRMLWRLWHKLNLSVTKRSLSQV